MLKRTINFEDYNGEQASETHYFNMTKAELIELEVEYKQGFGALLQNMIDQEDTRGLVREVKRLILLSYGEKSEDGRRFIKNDRLREEFAQTAAYQHLFMELAQDDKKASEFFLGILPRDLAEQADENKETPKVLEMVDSIPDDEPTNESTE